MVFFDTILDIWYVCMSTNPRCRRGLLCHWTRANAEWGRMAQNGATNTQSSGWVLTQFLLICGWAKVVKDDFVALIISWFGWYFARLQNLMTGMSWPMRLPTDGQPEIKFSWNFRWQTIAMRTPTHGPLESRVYIAFRLHPCLFDDVYYNQHIFDLNIR